MGRHSKSTTSWYLNTANMAKKRKASGRFEGGKPENGFESKGGKMGPITTYEDVADSEDEFHINRDKVLLDEGPDAKRRRKWQEEDAALEPSDEEVLGYSSESDDDNDEMEEPKQRRKSAQDDLSDDEEQQQEEEEEEEEEGWGGRWGGRRGYRGVEGCGDYPGDGITRAIEDS